MKFRQQALTFGVMLMLTVVSTGLANAQTLIEDSGFLPSFSEGTAVTPIPQFDPNLSNIGNTVFSTVTITADDVAVVDNGGNISSVFVTIEGLTHSNLSDLTVSVRRVADSGAVLRTATLFERVGINDAEGNNNGFVDNQNIDGQGSNANLSGTYRFQDGGSSLFEAANAVGDNGVVPTLVTSVIPQLPVYAPTGANGNDVDLFSAFATNDAGAALTLPEIVGTYEFLISDRSNQTPVTNVPVAGIQSFTRTSISFQAAAAGTPAIPEPGTAAAMLLGLIGLAARRRKA